MTIDPPPMPGAQPRRRRVSIWLWLIGGAAAVLLAVLVAPVVALAALALFITGMVALTRGTPTWLRLRSKGAAATAVIAGALLLVTSSGTLVAVAAHSGPQQVESVGFADAPTSAADGPSASTPAAVPRPAPTRTVAPTPTVKTRQEQVTEAIPYAESTVDSPDLAVGQTAVLVAGQNGVRTMTYTVTLVDGVETTRTLASDVVTAQPVGQVVGVGSYVEPQPVAAPAAESGSGCDSNYADACVPIASDVDCGGGSGDGPAYFSGVARVVGSDVYGLDRDGDGYACEPN